MRFFLIFLISFASYALDFSVISKGKNYDNLNTVLIFGGIQGDEPGGFHAASLLISDYKITKGRLLIAPNLAFTSIIERSRGTHGDLNRKFATLPKSDPDYKTIERIKSLILRKDVSMIINLHDGSGYYSPVFLSSQNNPARWGNSAIIDQESLEKAKYKELEKIASLTVANINKTLVSKQHKYHLKNTNTLKDHDKEMLKALTFFATKNHKSAFANEASKNLPTYLRVYYHLLAIESYLKVAHIEFTRDFPLTPAGVKAAINKPIYVKLFNNSLIYLDKNRYVLRFVPFPVNRPLNYQASNELTAMIKEKNSFYLQYGNRFKMRLYPEYFEFKNTSFAPSFLLDGVPFTSEFAKLLPVEKSFSVKKVKGIRVNIIGLATKNTDESGIKVSLAKLQKRYSLDKAGKIYRVEFYQIRGEKLANTQIAKNLGTLPFVSGIKSMSNASKKAQEIGIKNITKEQITSQMDGFNKTCFNDDNKECNELDKLDLSMDIGVQNGRYGTKRTLACKLTGLKLQRAAKKDYFLGMVLVKFK